MSKNIDGQKNAQNSQGFSPSQHLSDGDLCIFIPVYSASDRVRYNIENILPDCEKYNIDVYLCDSSDDNTIYDLFHSLNYEKLNYIDERKKTLGKIVRAYQNLSKHYSYVWLVGDSVVLRLDKVYGYLEKYISLKYDIIHFLQNTKKQSNNIEKTYNKAAEFYIDHIWSMTCFGASILSSDFISRIDWNKMNDIHGLGGFLIVMSIYENCAIYNFKAVCIYAHYCYYNIYTVASGWRRSGDTLKIFAKNWTEDNYKLPNIYNEYKDKAILSHDKNTHLFGIKSLMLMKLFDNITFEKIREYKKYIPLVTTTPIFVFYLIAICPKFLSRFCWCLKPLWQILRYGHRTSSIPKF